MSDKDSIVFHFCKENLYSKFINDISSPVFISLIKPHSKICTKIFSGCRVNEKSLKMPQVQKKLKLFSNNHQIMRDILGKSWVSSKKNMIAKAIGLMPYEIEYDNNYNWFKELKKLENKFGFDVLSKKLISALIYSSSDIDDIKIFISLLSIDYYDQDNLENYIDSLIKECNDKPEPFIKDLYNIIKCETGKKDTILEQKEKITFDLEEYREELKNNISEAKRAKEIFKEKINEKTKIEEEIHQKLINHRKIIGNIEKELQKVIGNKKKLELEDKKETQKKEYEQNKLKDESAKLKNKLLNIQTNINKITTEINFKQNLLNDIGEKIKIKNEQQVNLALEKKGLKINKDKKPKQQVSPTTFKIKEELEKLNNILGKFEPLVINNKGFISTPSTLSLIESLYKDDFKPPKEAPSPPETDSSLQEHVDYFKYKAFWSTDKWDQHHIIHYSYWLSKLLQEDDQKLSAEIALSGLFHSMYLKVESDENLLLYRFLCAVGNIENSKDYEEITDDDISIVLNQIIKNWEKDFFIAHFIGQLSLTVPQILDYLFEIASPRDRILLKRWLSRAFNGFINFDEHDPSHEIVDLIHSEIETHETKLRSSCKRWLLQDSIDAIAQTTRNELMANIARFPNIGRVDTKIILDDFKSQVSAPLTKATISGDPYAFEDLSKQCILFSKIIMKDKYWLSSVYLLTCTLHLANLAAEANIQAKRLFRAALSIDTDKQHYPLNITEKSCSVEVIIKNIGNAEAKNLKILIMPSKDFEEVDINGSEPSFDKLAPDQEIRHEIKINLNKPSPALHLEYIIDWKDLSSMDERSQTGSLKLLSQRKVDWGKAQNPYSLKSIKDPNRLKGRSDVLNILRRSRDSMDSYYITGQRRTGKSSIAHVYVNELNEKDKHASILLSWGDMSSSELTPICHAICYEFARKIRQRTDNDQLRCPHLDDFAGNENFIFMSFFKKAHNFFPDWKFFIVIDDFDELPSAFHQTEKGDQFFVLLRTLLDQDYIALYLVGSEKLPEILRRQGERLNLTQRCEIDYIKDTTEISKIITEPPDGFLEFHNDAINEIIKLSAGNPYYATLICSRLFNLMAQNKDYYVSKRDVELSTNEMLEEDTLSTYQHFWKDGVFLPGRLGDRQQYHNAKVLISLSRSQTSENQAVTKDELIRRDDLYPITQQDAEYAISGLLDRKVINEDSEGYSIRVPLFRKWLSKNGASAVERSFAEAGLDEVPINITRGLSTRDFIEVAQDLVYQDKEINEIQIADWLSQFGGMINQNIAYKLLKRLREQGYHNQSMMFTAFKELHKQIASYEAKKSKFAFKTERKNIVNLIISYLDKTGKSGHACEYAYRRINRIHSKCAIPPDKLVEYIKSKNKQVPIIFTDDIVGTGGTVVKGFKNFAKNMEQEGLNVADYNIYLAAIAGTKDGLEHVEIHTDGAINVLFWHEIDDKLHAFSQDAHIFKDDDERLSAKELVEEIGKELELKHPLGRNGGQLLIAFQHGCPNNTLPIFYKTGRTYRGKEWRPLFPR